MTTRLRGAPPNLAAIRQRTFASSRTVGYAIFFITNQTIIPTPQRKPKNVPIAQSLTHELDFDGEGNFSIFCNKITQTVTEQITEINRARTPNKTRLLDCARSMNFCKKEAINAINPTDIVAKCLNKSIAIYRFSYPAILALIIIISFYRLKVALCYIFFCLIFSWLMSIDNR